MVAACQGCVTRHPRPAAVPAHRSFSDGMEMGNVVGGTKPFALASLVEVLSGTKVTPGTGACGCSAGSSEPMGAKAWS